MYFDLNIPYSKETNTKEEERIDLLMKRIKSIDQATIAWNMEVFEISQMKAIPPYGPQRFPTIQQLTRVTVAVDDIKKNYQLVAANPLNQQIDILAVKPLTSDACKQACQVYEIDLISIDLCTTIGLPGYGAAQVAINRGIFFEICYSHAIRQPGKRALFFANVRKLIQHTRGHNLILSSGAIQALEIKRPSDIRMLALMFGMNPTQMEAAVGYNYQRLLRKAETRKNTIASAISINEPYIQTTAESTSTSDASSSKGKKRKNKPNNNNNNNKKQKKQKQPKTN
ncbi:RNase P subunit p30-domain-containing protein [Halteromyces radiatus]|uniref:RNase P subunit p30-domain-containing protein n=1 Tax=Halteromyces radiatus TaxID=101107 RepID=UPI00221F22D5|nr:RNase P subunit p30-domain-containing protein [Halteromyces radiatus]KAI8082755.1 RNase P subunit p30-domain-containing protein [Halteromyces radiatus]